MSLVFDENDESHRDFYRQGYSYRLRSSDPLPESVKKTPLGEIVNLGYTDAASGKKPRIPVNLPPSYFEKSGEPKTPEPPAAKATTTKSPSPSTVNPKKTPTTTPPEKVDSPSKADEEFLPPSDQAKYWYLRGYAGDAVREPAEFAKWYRAGLRDRDASVPSRVPPAPTPVAGSNSGGADQTDLTWPVIGIGGVTLVGLALYLSRRRKRSRR